MYKIKEGFNCMENDATT